MGHDATIGDQNHLFGIMRPRIKERGRSGHKSVKDNLHGKILLRHIKMPIPRNATSCVPEIGGNERFIEYHDVEWVLPDHESSFPSPKVEV